MKKLCYILFFALFILSDVSAQKLTAYFSYSVFNQPNGTPYIETYLNVIGNSVKFVPTTNGKYQSKIELQWILKPAVKDSTKKEENDKIIAYDKYNLLSPEIANDSALKPNFMDQKRIPAPNGDYVLELTISDKNVVGSKFVLKENVRINFQPDKLAFSDIELLESYSKSTSANNLSKSGYDLVPYLSNFYPQDLNSLKFYAELYNVKKTLGEDGFLFRYQIVNEGNKQIINDLAGYKKMKSEEVNVFVMEIPIAKLSSGNYSLVIEARDKNNQVVAYKASYFQRSNPIAIKKGDVPESGDFMLADVSNTFVTPINNKDTLKDYLACIYPISTQLDRQIAENQINYGTVESMKKYMYHFWAKKDSLNPEEKWLEYKAEVEKVNYSYKCYSRKGYDSDQGRVYLQYGPPNTVEIGDNAPGSYPYEIWHYYVLDDQTNRRFVFYSKFRAVSCYTLLSSDAKGEVYLYDWNYRLHPSQPLGTYGIDADDTQKNPYNQFGDKTRDDYDHPH